MILQRSNSGLYVPYDPPKPKTQAELMAEYRKLHRYCPECGREGMEQTCIGRLIDTVETYVDPNTGVCRCGWRGRLHDLTAERNANLTLEQFMGELKKIASSPPLRSDDTEFLLTDLIERFEASQRKESK